MKKTFNKIILAGLGITTCLLSACEKIVDINPPINEITTETVFSSDKLAANALSGLYTGLSGSTTQSTSLPVYSSIQADDLLYTGINATSSELFNNSYSFLSTFQSSIFSDWYSTIYRANAIIEGLQKYSGTSDAVKKSYTAEAKAIRAYCYFNLVNSFGEVPLVLTTNVAVNAVMPKTPIATIYAQMIADLTDAKANLLPDYTASSNTRLGVNRFVATALLARVSLFNGDYTAAESNASEVIASNLYSLIPTANITNGVWVKNNTESIWQMSPPINVTNQYTMEAGTFLPSFGGTAQYELRGSFVALFSDTDKRREKWMRRDTIGTTIKVLPFKYKYTTNALAVAAGVAESPTVLRLAEQYLIRAEARARTGTNLSGALSDMNMIRSRAEATASTTTDQATLLDEILLESRKELFCEQAYRWYNLKRTGQADAVLGALKSSYKPTAKLFPIPATAIDANPYLVQNPGY
ncbi:RagB/SusD family nutrient uptake outer membrane protein [Pedobacter sp. AW31-3R]|uniref:RagB/SusD family nutrient uptake outer membrane protein n=1 Tax=Pedobacter sp. AW31-3R TaxID=3445781 RepID=UPI003FA173F7